MLELIEATTGYESEIESFKAELLKLKEGMDGCGKLRESKTAEEFLKFCAKIRSGCDGFVPSQQYFAVINKQIVGMIDLRFHINHPVLSVWGGHIGYTVRPSKRRKGFAKEMLRLVLLEAKKRGITKVLITCSEGNAGSEKTILANNGKYEKTIEIKEESTVERIKRFWIDLES